MPTNIAKGSTSNVPVDNATSRNLSETNRYSNYATALADAAKAEGSWYILWFPGNYTGPANIGWNAYYQTPYTVGDFTAGFAVSKGGGDTLNITVPAAPTSPQYTVVYYYDVSIVGTVGSWYFHAKQLSVTITPVCLTEEVTVGEPEWNTLTGNWDYPVNITALGGTPPYTPLRPESTFISLAPYQSFTLSTSTLDSGSPQCSDNNSTPIGPAPAPPPINGPCFNVGAPESSASNNCDGGPMCIRTSGNNNVAGDSSGPQRHGNYARSSV